MISNDCIEIFILFDFIVGYQELIGDCDDSLPFLNWFDGADPHNAIGRTPKVRRISNSWISDHSIFFEPTFIFDVQWSIFEL